MRCLSDKSRLNGLSLPEVVRAWEHVTTDLSATLTYNGRKLKPGPLMSAVALAYCRTLSARQQFEMAKWGLQELERIARSENYEGNDDNNLLSQRKKTKAVAKKKP